MVEIFKSPVNLQKESTVREAAKSAPIVIAANSSARTTIPFVKTYADAPFVHYNIICTDDKFNLSHYISAVTNTGFTIFIENQDFSERSVIVMYEVMNN